MGTSGLREVKAHWWLLHCRCIAETSLILSGLNFNGYTDGGKARWDRYINTRIRKVEFCPSAAQLPQHWNICTGLFLRQCEWGVDWLGEGCRARGGLPQDSLVPKTIGEEMSNMGGAPLGGVRVQGAWMAAPRQLSAEDFRGAGVQDGRAPQPGLFCTPCLSGSRSWCVLRHTGSMLDLWWIPGALQRVWRSTACGALLPPNCTICAGLFLWLGGLHLAFVQLSVRSALDALRVCHGRATASALKHLRRHVSLVVSLGVVEDGWGCAGCLGGRPVQQIGECCEYPEVRKVLRGLSSAPACLSANSMRTRAFLQRHRCRGHFGT